MQASLFGATGVRVRRWWLCLKSGRAPSTLPRGGGGIGPRGRFGCGLGALRLGVCCLRLPARRRTRTVPLVGCLLTLAWSERAVRPGEAHCYVDVVDKVPSFEAAKTARRSSSSLGHQSAHGFAPSVG